MKIKSNVTVSLDYDVVARIKSRNEKLSPLINQLLISYIGTISDEDVEARKKAESIEEAKILIAEKQGQISELKKSLEKMERENKVKMEKEEQGWKIV